VIGEADELSEFSVDRREDGRQLLDQGDVEPSRPQGLGHLEPDVAGTHDHRPLGPTREHLVE
jgi:hypothetical protein